MTATVRRLAIGGATRVATGRIFHLYGPGEDRRRVVPAAAGALLAGRRFATSAGHQIRDFLHVEDVASAFVTLLERQAEGIVNIASGEPLALRRLVERIGELVGRPELIDFGAVGLRPGEPECLAGSNAKLRSLGWRPRYGLDDGLRSYLEPFAADAVRDN
jgi:nucleoside-diphosphate-sugar epimerase